MRKYFGQGNCLVRLSCRHATIDGMIRTDAQPRSMCPSDPRCRSLVQLLRPANVRRKSRRLLRTDPGARCNEFAMVRCHEHRIPEHGATRLPRRNVDRILHRDWCRPRPATRMNQPMRASTLAKVFGGAARSLNDEAELAAPGEWYTTTANFTGRKRPPSGRNRPIVGAWLSSRGEDASMLEMYFSGDLPETRVRTGRAASTGYWRECRAGSASTSIHPAEADYLPAAPGFRLRARRW